ncbi:MAG: hypothetical protein AAGI46_03095 [Planctomycetota bacterium]
MSRKTTLILAVVMLVLSGMLRVAAQGVRDGLTPENVGNAGTSGLAKLDSAALGLVLGGLRGPLVMALWTSTEEQRGSSAGGEQLLGGLDTKIELIRLLQPQFDSVHIQQIYNKAINLSAELVSPGARYAAILDGIDYGRRVIADRPSNIDIETQIGQVFSNKLGAADERAFFERRVRDETRAERTRARVVLPAAEQEAFQQAAFRAGISPRELVLRTPAEASTRTTVLDLEVARLIEADPDSPLLVVEPFDPRAADAATLRLARLEPMLDAEGRIQPSLTEPTRDAPEGLSSGEYLDGSQIQFVDAYGPFPEGLGPHALAFEHAMRAYVLQEHAGQRHIQHSIPYIRIQPGRNLRDWSLSTYEQGRQLEAEALGLEAPARSVDGREQALIERLSAGYRPGQAVPYPALLRRAVTMYERSLELAVPAADRFVRHLELHPEARGFFTSTIDRLQLNQVILEADIAYARLALGDETMDAVTLRSLLDAYLKADADALRYVMRFHVDPLVLPAGVVNTDLSGLPREQQDAVYLAQQELRNQSRGTGRFAGERVMDEFDGIRTRLAVRIGILRELLGQVR